MKRYTVPSWIAVATLPVAAAEGGGSSLIEPKIGTIFWTVLTFVALLFVLGRFAWKPLLGALSERENSISDAIERARLDREEAESLLQQQRELLEQSRKERSAAVEAGRKEADQLKSEILEEARGQRETLLQQTQAQIEAGMRQARSELRAETVDLALEAAQKLLARSLDDASHRRLIEDYLADLEGPEGNTPRPS